VAHGVLFALYPDNEAMGSDLAKLALALANGAPLRFEPNRGLRRAINRRTAEHLNIRLEPGDYDLVLPTR
jgi:putative ABC transport system substrate-binding protein